MGLMATTTNKELILPIDYDYAFKLVQAAATEFGNELTITSNYDSGLVQFCYESFSIIHYTVNISKIDNDHTLLIFSFNHNHGLLGGNGGANSYNKIADYLMLNIKRNTTNEANNKDYAETISVADEVKKFKELLDIGAITEDEYNSRKKQLLEL